MQKYKASNVFIREPKWPTNILNVLRVQGAHGIWYSWVAVGDDRFCAFGLLDKCKIWLRDCGCWRCSAEQWLAHVQKFVPVVYEANLPRAFDSTVPFQHDVY